jgi:glycosyltransferase involved in cell wall biosynthesis
VTSVRIAAVASHAVQYQAPWYRALAQVADLCVFFAHRATADEQGRAGFSVPFEWDVPLFDGYAHEWLTNVSSRPGVATFLGCDTPGISDRLDAGRFDAVVVNGWQLLTYWQAIRAARALGIPVFVRGDSQLNAERPGIRAAKRVVYPHLLKAFDGFLTVGLRNREYYERYGVPKDRLWPAPHAVDNAFFAEAAAAARQPFGQARARFEIPQDRIVFLLAARLVEMKRPLDFVRAVHAAHSARGDVHGLIVGDGPLRGALEAEARSLGASCTFAGFLNQREIGVAFAAADALVVTSDGRETWGLIVNEAMAAGLPALVSEAAGCAPDLVLPGETGFVFPCGDVAALAHLMQGAGRDALAKLGRGAAARIDRSSPEAAAAGTVAAVREMLARRSAAGTRNRGHAAA